MDSADLRVVEDISLDDVWSHEERDFTPWLVEHIDRLAETIGIEIDNVEREDAVGGYSADITGTELNTDGNVVIENQFGGTDHDHLGKLLTYAAGMDAAFVIWLAESFRDEHRSVLEWLNTTQKSGAMFFAVRPRVLTLHGSDELGFEFDVIVEPNDWEREIREPLSPREKAYKEFFVELTNRYADEHSNWNRIKARPQSWLAFGAGVSGVEFVWSFHQGPELATELYIDTGDKNRNEAIYSELKETRQDIEEALGDVVWQRLPNKRACRIKVARDLDSDIEQLRAMQKRELVEWSVESMDDLRDEIEPRLTSL